MKITIKLSLLPFFSGALILKSTVYAQRNFHDTLINMSLPKQLYCLKMKPFFMQRRARINEKAFYIN